MIGLYMNQPMYENDIRALMMAFFPGEKIVLNGKGDPYLVRILFADDRVTAILEKECAAKAGVPDAQESATQAGTPDASGDAAKAGIPDAPGDTATSGVPDAMESSAKADTPDVKESAAKAGTPDAQESAARAGAPGAQEGEQQAKSPGTPEGAAETELLSTLEDVAVLSRAEGSFDADNYKEGKNALKRTLYRCLSAYFGYELPWGTLTGIRPAKIVAGYLEAGFPEDEIFTQLQKDYFISGEKFDLALRVAKNEERILEDVDYQSTYSLYIGIPFCPTICAYCSFSSFPLSVWKKKVWEYLDILFYELEFLAGALKDRQMLTLYMGGGTPTSLTAAQMDRLLDKLSSLFDFTKIREITIESGRPDSITMEKLRVIKSYGIDRISINPQSMKQETLDAIGRRHTVEQVREAFGMARAAGFGDINMDLIAGLPGETLKDLEDTLAQIEMLSPDNLTVHSLAMKRAAVMNKNRDGYAITPPEEMNRMIHAAHLSAVRMGMEPYYLYRQKNIAGNLENVGYAKPGKEGLYNILIMGEKQTIVGAGAGASTKILHPAENRIERIENVKNVKDYMERIDEMIGRKRESLDPDTW